MDSDAAAPSGTDSAPSTPSTPATTTAAAPDSRPAYTSPEDFFAGAGDAASEPDDAEEAEPAPDEDAEPAPAADPIKALLANPALTPDQRKHIELMHRRSMQAGAEAKVAKTNYSVAEGWHKVAQRLIERARGAGIDVSDVLEGADEGSVPEEDDAPAFDLKKVTEGVLGLVEDKYYAGIQDAFDEATSLESAADALEASGDARAAERNRANARNLRTGAYRGMIETSVLLSANLIRESHGYQDSRYTRLSSALNSGRQEQDTSGVEAVESAYSLLDETTGKQRYADLFVPGQRKFSERGAKLIPAIIETAAARGLDPRDPENFDLLYNALGVKYPAARPKTAPPARGGDPSAVVERGAPSVSSPRSIGNGPDSEDPQVAAARDNRRAFARRAS